MKKYMYALNAFDRKFLICWYWEKPLPKTTSRYLTDVYQANLFLLDRKMNSRLWLVDFQSLLSITDAMVFTLDMRRSLLITINYFFTSTSSTSLLPSRRNKTSNTTSVNPQEVDTALLLRTLSKFQTTLPKKSTNTDRIIKKIKEELPPE